MILILTLTCLIKSENLAPWNSGGLAQCHLLRMTSKIGFRKCKEQRIYPWGKSQQPWEKGVLNLGYLLSQANNNVISNISFSQEVCQGILSDVRQMTIAIQLIFISWVLER